MDRTPRDIYDEKMKNGSHYPTEYVDVSKLIKESSYLLYEFKDSTEKIAFDKDSYDSYIKEKSPLFYDRVIDNKNNQELLSILTDEVPYYYLSPSIYTDLDDTMLDDSRDIGVNNVPSVLQESSFYETWFRDAFGYVQNLIILDVYNKLRYPYINENQYLDAKIFSKLAKTAFSESADAESRIIFKDTDYFNNEVYDKSYKYYGEEIGPIDYINDIIEKKIKSNYCFIDFSSEQSNFLSNLIDSLYESGQITYSETYTEKLIYKLQEIKNEILRRKLSGTQTLYKLALTSINRNGSYVGVIRADSSNVETNDAILSRGSANGHRPIRLLNTPGLMTTINTDSSLNSVDPINTFYTIPEDDDKIPLRLLTSLYYSSSNVYDSSEVINTNSLYNNELFYTGGYTDFYDCTRYITGKDMDGGVKYRTSYLRDNVNVIHLDSLEGIISQESLTKYPNTLDMLVKDEYDNISVKTLDSKYYDESDSEWKSYEIDTAASVTSLDTIYANILDINADHIMYHSNSLQQSLGYYYDYLTYPIADGNSVCLMDTFWLNYVSYQLENKTKVNDSTLIGTQVNTFVDMHRRDRQATYSFFGISYLSTDSKSLDEVNENFLFSYSDLNPQSIKYVLLWYCTVTYDVLEMKVVDFDKKLISKITLKSNAPLAFCDTSVENNNVIYKLKDEYKDCEDFTKYNIGVLPLTYKYLIDKKLYGLKLGFYSEGGNDTFYDDASSQGYSKAMFVFSKYDITVNSKDKNIDPISLGEDSIFTNELTDGIKNVYYLIKKVRQDEYMVTTKHGVPKYNEDGQMVESNMEEYFAWSDPIRVIDMKTFYNMIRDWKTRNIHFSPDWEGLSYHLNPYLNFTEKSASSLRHKDVYKAYDTIASEVPIDNTGKVKGTKDTYEELKSVNAANGDVYYVSNQNCYYIYDSHNDIWYDYNPRALVDGPSENAALSNLTRMRRLDFAANDLGESAPTHWIDSKYSLTYDITADHPSYKYFGLYLDKIQPESVNRLHKFSVISNILGDNRDRDIFDIEYKVVVYADTLPDVNHANEDTLYVIGSGKDIKNYILIDGDVKSFVEINPDVDLAKRSSICYSDVLTVPCLKIDSSYNFVGSSYDDETNTYKNYLKLSPCSESSLKKHILYVDSLPSSFDSLSDFEKTCLMSYNGHLYYYSDSENDWTEATNSDLINQDEVKKSKKFWYWNRPSEDGLTVCFNLEVSENRYFDQFVNDIYSESGIYYVKDSSGRFTKKRPTDLPEEVTSNNVWVPVYELAQQEETGVQYYRVVNPDNMYGNRYYERMPSFISGESYIKTGNYEQISESNPAVYNEKCEYYYKTSQNSYERLLIDRSLYGKHIQDINESLYVVNFTQASVSEGTVIPKNTYYALIASEETERYVLCGNDSDPNSYLNRVDGNYSYFTVSSESSPSVGDQLNTEESNYFVKLYNKVNNNKALASEESGSVLYLYKQVNNTYVPCNGEKRISGESYYIFNYNRLSYEEYELSESLYPINTPLPLFYYKVDSKKYTIASGEYDELTDYYELSEYKKYTVVNKYGQIANESDGFYIRNKTDSSQSLISRREYNTTGINAEFSMSIDQIADTNDCNIVFNFYPTGNSVTCWTCRSNKLSLDDFSSENLRISASIYVVPDTIVVEASNDDTDTSSIISVNKVIMSMIVNESIKSETFYVNTDGKVYAENNDGKNREDTFRSLPSGQTYTNVGLPVKYTDSGNNNLGDIYLFSIIDGNRQINNFHGNIYDFRLYNRGKAPEELLLLNMGMMRELYSYSPSVYKLAYSLYKDLGYLRMVENSDDSIVNKNIGAIRIFSRSVWDSIFVDNFPVSKQEMTPDNPQYYKYYNNPRYDSDIYGKYLGTEGYVYYLDDCVEQTLLDRLEVFNGKTVEQDTQINYNGNSFKLNTSDVVTSVFSTVMPISYNNEPIDQSNLKFKMYNNVLSTDYSDENSDKIIIDLKADASDDYFRYSTDMCPNFLIDSDFNLSQWLSRGTNISLVYDKNMNDSLVRLSDDSKKDSMTNNILVPLVLPKQTDSKGDTVGYLDRFYISNFKLSEYLIKFLRSTSYYSELRIPQPCKRYGAKYTEIEAISTMLYSSIPTYYERHGEGTTEDPYTYSLCESGVFESGKEYYHRTSNDAYVQTTDFTVGDDISVTYVYVNGSYQVAYGYFVPDTKYFHKTYGYNPSLYNKWDGIRLLKEGTYYVTCKYPIRLLPFNDEEFNSSSKYDYATVYGSIRFKIEVSSSPKNMSKDEENKYRIEGIPNKYLSRNIVSTLKNPSELIDPDDNRTFPHREMTIRLYAMDTPDKDLAGLMKLEDEEDVEEGSERLYEEQYNFSWKLIASNDKDDCYTEYCSVAEDLTQQRNYFVVNENHEFVWAPEINPGTTYYVFDYKKNDVTYIDKESLNEGCIIKKKVSMFLSKNYTLPFFVRGLVKTENDEHFSENATSADDDLIEPIKIRPNFNKFKYYASESNEDEDNPSISYSDEKLSATNTDDLDHIVLVAGKSYKVLFDYTAKLSELAYTNDFFNDSSIMTSEEKLICSRYYSLIDNLGVLNSQYQYISDGNSFTIPSEYTDFKSGFDVEDTYTKVTSGLKPGVKYYKKTSNNTYEVETSCFQTNTEYFTKESNWIEKNYDSVNKICYYGDPDSELSSNNAMLDWKNSSSSESNIKNSYKINYMTSVEDDIRDIFDISNESYPKQSSNIDIFRAYTTRDEAVEIVDNFSESDIIKTLYQSLKTQSLISDLQSSSSGAIGGFTTVSPNISYRKVGDIEDANVSAKYNVEVYPDTHDLYSYICSSRIMPYKGTFNVTRKSLFKNNLLKGKQLDYLNSSYWSISGDYGVIRTVEDSDFEKSVMEVDNVNEMNMIYDGGNYVLNAEYESAINIKVVSGEVSSIKIYYYDVDNNLINENGYELTKDTTDEETSMYNYHYNTSESLSACKIRFKITGEHACVRIGKIIVRGNATTSVANGLSNVYYSNSFSDQNIILASHVIPVLLDLETNQYIPIQFKNGQIHANSQIRPNPSLNMASEFISRNILSGYGNKSKITKLNKPWIRRLYYEHGGVKEGDSLDNSAYFHKYDIVMDSFNIKKTEETFSSVNDIFKFTKDSEGKMDPDKCFVCSRNENGQMVLEVGNNVNNKYYGIELDLSDDGSLTYFNNNMKINRNNPITVSDQRLSMTFNCFNLDSFRNNVSSPVVVTNVQLLNTSSGDNDGSFEGEEVIYEFEYLPIIYDELKHHISFNIMIKR